MPAFAVLTSFNPEDLITNVCVEASAITRYPAFHLRCVCRRFIGLFLVHRHEEPLSLSEPRAR